MLHYFQVCYDLIKYTQNIGFLYGRGIAFLEMCATLVFGCSFYFCKGKFLVEVSVKTTNLVWAKVEISKILNLKNGLK